MNGTNGSLPLLDPRPSRADAIKNRELLLETARRLFAEQGVETVSMTAIAEAAGVGKGTLYRHFPDKLSLCMSLLDHEQTALQNRSLAYLRSQPDPVANLRWFVAEVCDFVLQHSSLLQLHQIGGGNLLGHSAHAWWRQTLRGLLAQSLKSDPDADIDYMADVLYIMLDGRSLTYQMNFMGCSPERIHQGLQALVDKLLA